MEFHSLTQHISTKIDGICITDHDLFQAEQKFLKRRVKVFFGAELTTRLGDILVYGVSQLPLLYYDLHQTFREIHNNGGIIISAHPFAKQRSAFGEAVYDYYFDAIEINGGASKQENESAKQAAKILDVPLVGGSDAHFPDQLNSVATLFETKIESMHDIVTAVKNHECKPIFI